MSNTVTLQFAGDAQQLQRAGARSEQAITGVGAAANRANEDFTAASRGSTGLTDRMSKLGNIVDGASTAIGDAAGTMQALADVQDYARARAQRLAQALADVEQAQEDANQAILDGKQALVDGTQATIDAEQALLDQATAQKDYNEAVREHGAGSAEARQAAIDLKQAQADLTQANLDAEQAQRDANQATIDGRQAQIDLNEATHEANPPKLQDWAEKLNLIAPLLSGLVGIVALATAVQWAWNVALTANPIGLIIAGVALLIAAIVLIATKTTWFQDLWRITWGAIKDAAAAVWDWLQAATQTVIEAIIAYVMWVKDNYVTAFTAIRDFVGGVMAWFLAIPDRIGAAFSRIAGLISAPFRAAFNYISDAWNNTVGSLRWSVPGWVPGVGGNSISAPRLPHFHQGGTVPGLPGQEVLAVLQAGETVTPAGRNDQPIQIVVRGDGTATADLLVRLLQSAIQVRGGAVQGAVGTVV